MANESQVLNDLAQRLLKIENILTELSDQYKFEDKPYKLRQRWITVTQVADYTGFEEHWIRKNANKLGGNKVGGVLRFKRETIDQFMEGKNGIRY